MPFEAVRGAAAAREAGVGWLLLRNPDDGGLYRVPRRGAERACGYLKERARGGGGEEVGPEIVKLPGGLRRETLEVVWRYVDAVERAGVDVDVDVGRGGGGDVPAALREFVDSLLEDPRSRRPSCRGLIPVLHAADVLRMPHLRGVCCAGAVAMLRGHPPHAVHALLGGAAVLANPEGAHAAEWADACERRLDHTLALH